jgi:hypothetical protein
MRWQLRRLAGSPTGEPGDEYGTFDETRFNSPRDLVLNADESKLYVADYHNRSIRQVQLDDGWVSDHYRLQDWPRWDAAGTLSGRPRNITIGMDGFDEKMRITADNLNAGQPGVLFEWNLWNGDQECSLSTAGTLGAIAQDPGDTTATAKMRLGETGTGWGTLALKGPARGQITEPPVMPDPPFCDPPTNSVPVEVVNVREAEPIENSGLARIGSVIVAFRWLNDGTDFGIGVLAFDPWNELPGFPSPYTTCTTPTAPAAILVPCLTGTLATPFPPWNATHGPDHPDTGLPTVIGAAWRSPNGILLRAQLDTDNAELHVDYQNFPGLADLPVMGVAYSATRETYYFTTADMWGDPGPEAPPNQILALEYVPDPPTCTGGSGRMPIGPGLNERPPPLPPEPVGIVDEQGDVLVEEGGDALIFG